MEIRLEFEDENVKLVAYQNQAKYTLPFGSAGLVLIDKFGKQHIQKCTDKPTISPLFARLDERGGVVNYERQNYLRDGDPIDLPDSLWTPCFKLAPKLRAKTCNY